jgi:hypothetical protein
VDCTVVETNVHHPTDSSLLGDGCQGALSLAQAGEEGAVGRSCWLLLGKGRLFALAIAAYGA